MPKTDILTALTSLATLEIARQVQRFYTPGGWIGFTDDCNGDMALHPSSICIRSGIGEPATRRIHTFTGRSMTRKDPDGIQGPVHGLGGLQGLGQPSRQEQKQITIEFGPDDRGYTIQYIGICMLQYIKTT